MIPQSLNSSNTVQKSKSNVSSETQGKFLSLKPYKNKRKVMWSQNTWHRLNIPILKVRNRRIAMNDWTKLRLKLAGQTLSHIAVSLVSEAHGDIIMWTPKGSVSTTVWPWHFSPHGLLLVVDPLITPSSPWQIFHILGISTILWSSFCLQLYSYSFKNCLLGVSLWGSRPCHILFGLPSIPYK
jgi:hypothetical protein